ncbi:MAG: beta-glucosidase [Lentisphaeria bacterium]|nr:beta-glucosidase [Lentisphaeria bacterium]
MKRTLLFLLSSVLAAAAWTAPVAITATGPDRPTASPGAGTKALKVKLDGEFSGTTIHGEIRKWGDRKLVGRIAPAKAKAENELAFRLPALGIYDITVIVERGKERVASTECTYSAVPQPLPAGDRPQEMGACTHFAQGKGNYPATFELLKLAGFTRVRDDLAWNDIEWKPGEYRIRPEMDRFVNTANQYGLKPLLVTGYNNDRAYPGKFKKAFPTAPEMYEAYGNAVVFAVKHFGSRVNEWELWNEPNSAHPVNDYLPMLKTVYPKIKAARPDATVISCGGGGAGGGPGGGMIMPIAGAGGIEFQDGFSIHPYMAPHEPDFGYNASGGPIPAVSIPVFTKHLRNFVDRHPKKDGRKLKFYITELGWPVEFYSYRNVPVTLMSQAAFFARTILLNRANGCQPLYWYDFQNDGTDPRFSEHNFGLINVDFSPKPAYQAAAVVASMLRNKPFSGPVTDAKVTAGSRDAVEKGVCKLYAYGRENDRVIALWCAEQSLRSYRVEFPLPFPYEQTKLIDWQGAEQPLPKKLDGNRIELQLTALPQYIVKK